MLAKRLLELRKNKNLSQKLTAESVGISERMYQYLESGMKKPSYDTLIMLCNFFEISADYLLGLSDDPERK